MGANSLVLPGLPLVKPNMSVSRLRLRCLQWQAVGCMGTVSCVCGGPHSVC